MSVDQEFSNPSFVRYEINGSQFIVQSLENAQETVGRIIENENDERVVKIVDTATEESDEDESIPLVCVDGQIYAIHNGELQALDISQMEYENDENCNDGKKVVEFGKDKVNPEGDCIEITRYESDSDPPLLQETDEMEPQSDESRQLYVVAKNNISTSDFAEIVTALKCKACPYTTQNKAELMKHFRKFHANPIAKVQEETARSDEVKLLYMCGECSNCFPSMDACREHMIKDHQLMVREDTKKSERMTSESPKKMSQQSFKPTILGARRSKSPVKENSVTTKTRSSQRDKKSLDLKDRQVKCTYRGCPHKFSTDITMQQHAICHIDVPYYANIFKCSICRDEKFTKWKPCSLHLWKKHEIDVDLFSCNICKAYKSATMVKLLTHMRVHSDNREFECPDCGKCFKQSSQLRNHRVMHRDRKTTNVPRWYTSKTCDLCGKTYADSKCLKNHIQAVHSKLRPYVCNVCGHSSARKAMLQMHLRQHTGDKPFNCELCDYKTGDHNSLRRHMMRHTGVRPYKCPHCPYSAIQSNSYKNHLRVKHPLLSGLFTCELCPFKTVKNESYLQHIGDHEKGLIKTPAPKKDGENVEVFPGNIAAAQLIYSCLGAFSKVGKTIEASLMSSSTSADGTSQTITIQIPSKHLEGSLPTSESSTKNIPSIEQEDDETMHCFLKIPREEEENIDTGGITIPAEPEDDIVVDS